MGMNGRATQRGPDTAAALSHRALFLAAILLAPVSPAQEAEPASPYRFYGGEVDQAAKNAAVEACEYRVLVEEQRCNEAINKTACIARVHGECLADPDREDRDTATDRPGKARRQDGPA